MGTNEESKEKAREGHKVFEEIRSKERGGRKPVAEVALFDLPDFFLSQH